jgi:hypothetical protein
MVCRLAERDRSKEVQEVGEVREVCRDAAGKEEEEVRRGAAVARVARKKWKK